MTIRSFVQVIDLWPSTEAFAKTIGVPTEHARVMKARDSIPVEYWDKVIDGADAWGFLSFDMEDLQKLTKRARRRGRAA